MSISISRALRVLCALVLALGFASSAFAQQSIGKVRGSVLDKGNREPLPAASVRIENTTMGAMANDKGEYFILNVPPGVYSIIVNVIGYTPMRVTSVKVVGDLTTQQNFELETTVLESAEAVEVIAERPLVEKTLTSSRTIVDAKEIKSLPVVNVAEILLTTAGSFAGNLRGGRAQDVQMTLDGSTISSQRGGGGQAFGINPFMIQELEVKTGTFNAEYVNALSGITSIITKDGGSKFSGNMEYRTLGQKGLNWATPPDMDLADAFRAGELNAADLRALINGTIAQTNAFNANAARQTDGLKLRFPFDRLDTTGAVANWTASYSRENYYWDYDRINPEADAAGFSYLTTGRPLAQANSNGTSRVYTPDKYNEFAIHNRTEKRPTQLDWGMGGPLGGKVNWFASGRFNEDWGRSPDEYHRGLNFFGKVTYQAKSNMKFSVSGLMEDTGFFSKKGQRGGSYGWKYIPEGLNQSYGGQLHFNLNFSHTLSPKTYYEIRVSHLREYAESYNPAFGKGPLPATSLARGSIGFNPLETTGLPAVGYQVYGTAAYGDITSGNYADIRPFKTDINFAMTNQMTTNHQFKLGVGLGLNDYHESRRGPASGQALPLFNANNGRSGVNTIPLSGWEYHVYPTEYFLYAQDRIEYGSLVVNAGMRLDMFDAKSNNINPFQPRPGAAIDDPQYRTVSPSIKTGLAPRLGISHPITDRAALHYSYGVFNQRPVLSEMFDGLVQSYPFERNHGNPDLPFQKATNYEMGLQAEVYSGYYLDVTGYFRDVNNLPADWLVAPEGAFLGSGQREISLLLPTFAQDSRGLEVSFRRNMANHFSMRANYTLAFTTDLAAQGGQIITTNAQYLQGTPTPSRYQKVFSALDRRHRFVTNMLIELPFGISTSFLTKAQSGNEYRTKNQQQNDPLQLLGAGSRSPWTTTTDMYMQKAFTLGKTTRFGVFTQVSNLFNKSNIYTIGGSPSSDRYVRRGDPVGLSGGPMGGIGSQGNNPRDIWVGFNVTW